MIVITGSLDFFFTLTCKSESNTMNIAPMPSKTMYKADWISATFKGTPPLFLSNEQLIIWLADMPGYTYTLGPGLFGYAYSATFDDGTMVLIPSHENQHKMGFHVQKPGKSLAGENFNDFCSLIAQDPTHWKVTRLDLAADCIDSGLDMGQLQTLAELGQFVSRSKKVLSIKSQGGGHTIYLGARGAERFLRIYDKRAELMVKNAIKQNELPDSLIRIELEMRDDIARAVFAAILDEPDNLAQIAKSAILRFANFGEQWESALTGEMGEAIVAFRTRQDKKKQWLVEVAIPALLDYCRTDHDLARGVIHDLTIDLLDNIKPVG